jgi:hypothetical protein
MHTLCNEKYGLCSEDLTSTESWVPRPYDVCASPSSARQLVQR